MNTGECKSIKISILSAMRNEEQHVAEMIESVQNQDFLEWELLVVDDGSTDRTADIVKEFASRDPRISLVADGSPVGKVRAFNLAFAASSGQIIVLLAGDDRIPRGSLGKRYRAVADLSSERLAVGYFKIRTFSEDPKFDNVTLPKKKAGSRSGGSISMNRALAEKLFPILETLVAEDLWLGYGSEFLASRIVESPEVVLEYRIHSGNSNPRNADFATMSESMHLRHCAWRKLAESDRLELDPSARRQLEDMWTAEELRHAGRLFALARFPVVSLSQRIGLLSMAHPILFGFRKRLFRYFSGRRGR